MSYLSSTLEVYRYAVVMRERDLCWQLAEFILLCNSAIAVARHYSIAYTCRPTDLQQINQVL